MESINRRSQAAAPAPKAASSAPGGSPPSPAKPEADRLSLGERVVKGNMRAFGSAKSTVVRAARDPVGTVRAMGGQFIGVLTHPGQALQDARALARTDAVEGVVQASAVVSTLAGVAALGIGGGAVAAAPFTSGISLGLLPLAHGLGAAAAATGIGSLGASIVKHEVDIARAESEAELIQESQELGNDLIAAGLVGVAGLASAARIRAVDSKLHVQLPDSPTAQAQVVRGGFKKLYPQQRVQGSELVGGIQPSFVLDTSTPRIKALLEAARGIGADSKLTVQQKVEAIRGKVRDSIAYPHDPESYRKFLALNQAHVKTGVPLEEYHRIGYADCRGFAITTQLMLQEAGLEGYYTYVKYYRAGQLVMDHATNVLKDGNSLYMVDSLLDWLNGQGLRSMLHGKSVNRIELHPTLPYVYADPVHNTLGAAPPTMGKGGALRHGGSLWTSSWTVPLTPGTLAATQSTTPAGSP